MFSGEFTIHLHSSTLELECNVDKAHLAVYEFFMRLLFIGGSNTGGMDIRGDVVVQNVVSLSLVCTYRDTYTEMCCCCHLQNVTTYSLIFSTCRNFLINIVD